LAALKLGRGRKGGEGGGEGRKRSLKSGGKPTEALAAHAKKLMGKGRNRRRHAGYHKKLILMMIDFCPFLP